MGEPKNSFLQNWGGSSFLFAILLAFLGRHTGIPQFAQTQVLSCAGTSSVPPALPGDVVRTDFGYKDLKHWKKCKEMGMGQNPGT